MSILARPDPKIRPPLKVITLLYSIAKWQIENAHTIAVDVPLTQLSPKIETVCTCKIHINLTLADYLSPIHVKSHRVYQ